MPVTPAPRGTWSSRRSCARLRLCQTMSSAVVPSLEVAMMFAWCRISTCMAWLCAVAHAIRKGVMEAPRVASIDAPASSTAPMASALPKA